MNKIYDKVAQQDALWLLTKQLREIVKAQRVPGRDNPRLLPRANWQTPVRGTNEQEYDIYVENARDLGWQVKTYQEWLQS